MPALRTIIHRFRYGGDLRPLVCLGATAATGLILAGIGMTGGWLAGMTRPGFDPAARRIGNVRVEDITTGGIVTGAVWLVVLFWVWRPVIRFNRHSFRPEQRQRWIRPILISMLLGAIMVVLSYAIYRKPWDKSHYLVTGLSLVAGGSAVVFWLPVLARLEHGRPLVGPGQRINVHCPRCSYSMAGLRETTCPECGARYTIDELIREQGYEDR